MSSRLHSVPCRSQYVLRNKFGLQICSHPVAFPCRAIHVNRPPAPCRALLHAPRQQGWDFCGLGRWAEFLRAASLVRAGVSRVTNRRPQTQMKGGQMTGRHWGRRDFCLSKTKNVGWQRKKWERQPGAILGHEAVPGQGGRDAGTDESTKNITRGCQVGSL